MATKRVQKPRGAQRHAARQPATQTRSALSVWANRVLVGSACLMVLAGSVHAAAYLYDMQVERIAVSGGLDQVSTADIEAQVATELGQGFLMADLDQIRVRLERMPWVHTAQVRRHWPNTIGIQVIEQQPIARWANAGYLNHEGDFFPGAAAEGFADLPLLEGPQGSTQLLMQRYLRLEQVLAPLGLEVVNLAVDEVDQLEVTFDNGTQLLLGNREFALRLQRFGRLWRSELQGRPVASIDMRYEHGAAVRENEQQLTAITGVAGGDI